MNKPQVMTAALLFALATACGQAQAVEPPTQLQSLLELNAPATATRLPTIKAWKLKQNTRVLFVENHTLPMIDVQISFAAGSNQDGDSPGLAAMVLSLFNEGTALKDANALAEGFDRLGVELGNGINKEQSHFTLRSLSALHIREPAMQLFTEMLARPGFTVEGQRRVKNELLTQLKINHDSPHALAQSQIYNDLYPGHPNARSTYGSADSLERIDESKLKAFYRRAYTAANAHIVIVGDLSPQQAQILSRTLADALPAGPALADSHSTPAPTPTGKTLHIEDEATQTLLMLAQNALPNQHPDGVAIRVGHIIFSHILNEHLREERSITYGVSSDIPHAMGPTPWIISLNTPSRYSHSVQAHIKSLFAQYLEEGPSEAQLDDIKQYLLRALPQLTASNLEMRNELSVINRFNHPLSFNHKNQQVQALTREQVKAAMNRYFKADGWVSVTVGPTLEQQPLPEVIAPDPILANICMSAIS
ncbi:M16 family metallopeptidase [Pseudomonas kulmbachensis]|uniref:M16 family metallopeptidase n=1 Tax=Pseudomonas kulmbachensis TaxID=3043408 RepID=UPI002AB0219A|nr:pitrilysin family protein [Pseudomonas sp. V3/3/4/13]